MTVASQTLLAVGASVDRLTRSKRQTRRLTPRSGAERSSTLLGAGLQRHLHIAARQARSQPGSSGLAKLLGLTPPDADGITRIAFPVF